VPSARIIPCLDVVEGRVVKGVRFRDHRDVGDIVELATNYRDSGADELVFYDIAASPEGRPVDVRWVERVAAVLDIPFSVAGGIASVGKAREVLRAGADKISINSPALSRPALIAELADEFGRQCVVVGIDSLRDNVGRLRVKQFTGRPEMTCDSGRDTLEWAKEVATLGAGEIVLNCMNRDGVRDGFDLEQLRAVAAAVDVPIVISGGAGTIAHFAAAFRAGASGALAASVFHDGLIAIPELKAALEQEGLEVRR
jgi:imidazole glycerol-phosphate synthase subunit HisF